MRDESDGVLYVAKDEPKPATGEPILIVPISPVGLPDYSRSVFGVVGGLDEDTPRLAVLGWKPRREFAAWGHRCTIMAGAFPATHIAVPFRSVLFHEIVEDQRSALWVGAARHASDDAERARVLAEAKAEIRGLRKRMRIEREVTIGIFQGLVDERATERLLAHLDLLVGKSNAAATSDVGAQGEATGHPAYADTVAALEKVAVSLERARRETPDVQDTAFANGATHLRLVAAGLSKCVSPHLAVDPETVALLKELVRYLDELGDRKMHDPMEYVRLLNDCTAALARATPHPAAAPAQVAVEPGVIGEISTISDMLNQHVVRADHVEKTEEVIGDAARRLHAILKRLRWFA